MRLCVGLAVVHLLLWLLLVRALGDTGVALMVAPALAQLVGGMATVVAGVQLWRADRYRVARHVAGGALAVGVLAAVTAPLLWVGGATAVALRGLEEIEIPSLASP